MISDLGKIDQDDFLNIKKIEKMKEELLEETFKIAESSKKTKKLSLKEKKDLKKFIPIFGVIFIVIAIVSLFIINYLPWMYINYNDPNFVEIDGFFYRDFKTKFEHEEIFDLMGSKCDNCSDNSQNYIGLSTEDFIYTPQYSFYLFIALIFLGLFSIIFAIIDKFRNISMRSAILFYSISAIAELIIGLFILLFNIRFIGANFLLIYNKSLIENIGLYNVKLIMLTPILLIVFALIMIKGAKTSLDLNFKELQKRNQSEKTSRSFSTFKYGSSV